MCRCFGIGGGSILNTRINDIILPRPTGHLLKDTQDDSSVLNLLSINFHPILGLFQGKIILMFLSGVKSNKPRLTTQFAHPLIIKL